MPTPTRISVDAFIRNFSATVAAVVALASIAWMAVGDSVTSWAQRELGTDAMAQALGKIEQTQAAQADTQRQQQQTIATISDTQSRTADTLNAVVERIAVLERTGRDDRTAPARFAEEGNAISNARIGDFVTFTVRYIKTRDCGRPISVAYFRNGGGIIHAFQNASTTAADGRASAGPVSSEVQTARFVARIPENEGVRPTSGGGSDGYATGWILMSWPNCPNAPEVRSPLMPFQILPAAK